MPEAIHAAELKEIFSKIEGYNGYKDFDGDLGTFANTVAAEWAVSQRLPESTSDIKSCLFYEFRRSRFVEGYPSLGDMPYLKALREALSD